jgi:hypothetical protein
MKRARGLLLIGTFLAVAGCGEPSVPTARPTYVAAVEPSPSSTQDPFAAAIRHRAMLGLANDEQHVREVADDPAAVERGKGTYGFPLTAEEFALLERRARGMDDVGEVVRRYGAGQPDTWAGWSVDTPKGLVIAQFTADLPAHRRRLRPCSIRMRSWSSEQPVGLLPTSASSGELSDVTRLGSNRLAPTSSPTASISRAIRSGSPSGPIGRTTCPQRS